MSTHLAVDLGAESGRVMVGRVGETIALEEVHRWPSRRVRVMGGERWDVLFMWAEILEGLRKAAAVAGDAASVSVDSWGVDYVLLKDGHPHLTPPFMYRDERTTAAYERLAGTDDQKAAIFAQTGIQFMPINTAYQLASDTPGLHESADGLLLIADYFNFLLSGVARHERSLASTTQLYDPTHRQWADFADDVAARKLLEKADFVDAGQTLGPIAAEVAEQTGLPATLNVVATCSHDTGNAVAATPLTSGAAYLSSGTWSLLGVEADAPVLTDAARGHNFTNEVGLGHSIRLLKNLSGLFLVQESRKDFDQSLSYADLAEIAANAGRAQSLIRPDAPQFTTPGHMTGKIADYCRATDQPVPESPGGFVRCCYESLALLYGQTIGAIGEITGRTPTKLNIVGGGSNADLLNQFAADATGLPVEAGPAEATALGNVGIQAIAAGTLADLADLRRRVRASSDLRTFQPSGDLAEQADRFAKLPT
jgi:rhamnulokinase